MAAMTNPVPAHVALNNREFNKFFPSIVINHRNEFALMRDGVVIRYYKLHGDAQRTGKSFYPDGRFSIKKVTE